MQSRSLATMGTPKHLKLVDDVCAYIKENPAERITLSELGNRFSVSPYHLQRVFVDVMGISPRKYVEECRVGILKLRLARGQPVVGAIRGSGYSSQSWLYKDSRSKLGMTPADYKAGGRGITIMYATGDSSLGRMLVAATEHGVCSVNVGEDDEVLLGTLRKEFGRARITRSGRAERLLERVRAHLTGQRVKFSLDLRGTEFQLKVWAAIQQIPRGSTRTYTEIAEAIGEPTAVRAVANACGSNPVPLIVPCHRVIRKDGSLGGYGLGVDRKKKLLVAERKSEA